MIDFQKLIPKRGDLILPWWRNALEWARSLPVIIGPNVRLTQTPMGLKIRVKTGEPVSTPFEVSVTGSRARILPGSVEDVVPWILNGGEDPVRLDGRLEDGSTVSIGSVFLDLSDAEPNGEDLSAIVVKLSLKDGRYPDSGEDPESLVVEHLSDFGPEVKRRLAEDGVGFQVLARVYWRDGRISRVGQVVHHDLKVNRGEDGRLFFSGI